MLDKNFNTQISQITLNSEWLGLVSYEEGLELQTQSQKRVLDNPELIYLLGLEHPSVITLGQRAVQDQEILILDKNIQILRTERGGLATAHNPGQLVIYPILNLTHLGLGAKEYVGLLLNITVQVLAAFHVKAFVPEYDQGVYTEKGKIAFCGVRIKNKITSHGLSINISNDLKIFENIRPCGFTNLKLDRFDNYNNSTPIEFYKLWVDLFSKQVLDVR
ncbi:MAG TPA: lipoyl(octanoyl) transferase LipB [Pseudobdellovibrionaceae bacterium]|nr:lipoyl(octanoyl) transferase LipB [Pseudobdellovibrionaceae bacterium]